MPTSIKSFLETMTSPSIQNKVPEIDQVVINMGELSDRIFKAAILRKLNEHEKSKRNTSIF
jgi:hypothetical protein